MTVDDSTLFTIVVPTFQRRDVVSQSVQALAALRLPGPSEVVVVVDGSTDGTAGALRALDLPMPLTVLEQENAGAAAARNAGAAVAKGRYLLFLDDDMQADPGLLEAHRRLLDAGADAVVGHIPLHPDSPHNLLTDGVRLWAERRRTRLLANDGDLEVKDLLTGQLSVRRELFGLAAGFDQDFTAGGTFGGEDTEFLHRLVATGAVVRFAPDAVSYQRYVVTPDQHLRQWRQAGAADAALVRKHPELHTHLAEQHGSLNPATRALVAAATRMPRLTARWRAVALHRAAEGRTDLLTRAAYHPMRRLEYATGLRDAGGLLPPGRVLCYHGVTGRPGPLSSYSVTPEALDAQLTAVRDAGWHLLSGVDAATHLAQGRLPRGTVAVTFDDAYVNLLTDGVPVLDRHGVTGVVFVVSGQVGGTNAWDSHRGGTPEPLLDAAGLQTLVDGGWVLGAHSSTHGHLRSVPAARLAHEVAEAREVLPRHGLPRPDLFAYPYGEHDARVRRAVRRAGYVGALALVDVTGTPAPARRWAQPRIEVTGDTTPASLVEALADPPTGVAVRSELVGVARRLLRR